MLLWCTLVGSTSAVACILCVCVCVCKMVSAAGATCLMEMQELHAAEEETRRSQASAPAAAPPPVEPPGPTDSSTQETQMPAAFSTNKAFYESWWETAVGGRR